MSTPNHKTHPFHFPDDPVDHPRHYNGHPSGVECIVVAEHMGFNIGNVIKYCWRAGEKPDAIEDLKKAQWYLAREIDRLEKSPVKVNWGDSFDDPGEHEGE